MTYQTMLGATALTLCLAAGSASAQSRCGTTYEVEPGDTLYRIAQQCRVSLASIYDLNRIENARDIRVGRVLQLDRRPGEGDSGSDDRVSRSDRYRIEAGDTPYAIAQALGVSLAALLAENSDLDPFDLSIGEWLDVPQGDRNAGINVSPLAGPPGSDVTVQARGLVPTSYVTIGAGPMASEWNALANERVARDGEISTTVEVPDWARPGDILTFVVDTDSGVTLKSRDFDVVRARGEEPGNASISLEGRVKSGVECYTITTPDGDLWSLVSSEIEFTAGEYVEVSGTRAEMSFCQQGIGTVDVSRIEEVQPG